MENSALDEERSTYTEGENKSRRSSILKPPKARAPLQEVNLGGSADDTEDFDILRKRRVSFAGVNSVKEFCSQAESLQVCQIQSYEETFSTSSDNSHNSSAAKSVQLVTPKNVVPSGDDYNFADDPMDLTDSVIDSNLVANRSAPTPVVQVLPGFTSSALLESAMNKKPDLPSWSYRKTVSISNAQNSLVYGNITSSNMSISSVVGAPAQRASRNPDPPVAMSSPWSCSMEMTEPVHFPQYKMSSVNEPSNQEQIHFAPFRNPIKLPEQSDSGMEFTEMIPVKIRPFSINQANDNFGDTSMEMTEVMKKTDVKSFCSRMSVTNKSASMDFTEVAQTQRKSVHFHNFQSATVENSLANCGMEFTEPIKRNFTRSDPSENVPLAQHLISAKKSYPAQGSNFESKVPDCEKSMSQIPENQSSSDMEMTGVLSLSKYNKLVSNDDENDDMDFTHLLSVNYPKKARMNNEPEDEPFQMISPLSTKVPDVQQTLDQNKPLTSQQSIPVPLTENKSVSQTDQHETNADQAPVFNQFDDDDDTIALNFKNINRIDSPIELSFLKEFRDSPTSKVVTGHNLTMNHSAGLFDHEHLLLYSPPKDSKPAGSELKNNTGFGRVSIPLNPSNQKGASDLHQPIPTCHLNSQKKCSIDSFEAQVLNELRNVEPESIPDPLRNVRSSRSFMGDVSLPERARASFKDFEIRADNMAANECLSTVGLDDSDILKAGLNDMTCPERVASVCMSVTSNLASPCSKSRMSLVDRSTFVNSVTQGMEKKCEQTHLATSSQPEFGGIVGIVDARENQHMNRRETYDDHDSSVSTPFIFKLLSDRTSETHKFGQSIPVVEFEESPKHQEHQPKEDSGVSSPNQKTTEKIVSPSTKKSINPNPLISDREANDQDTSISMPFVFKAVEDKRRSDVHKLGQSFPIIEFGEAQSSALMELTEVAPPGGIEPRKSLGRMNPEQSSIQPSGSSGLMELTDVVAVHRKSMFPSNQTATAPQDSSGIEMDEKLVTIKSPKKDTLTGVCSDATASTEWPVIMSCDMEQINVKPKDVPIHRKSFFPQDQSPLSLSAEETITRPNTSGVASLVEQSRKSCVSIDNEDTFAKSSLIIPEVPTKETISSGAIDMDMEQTAMTPQIRLSLAPESRKSFFDPQVLSKSDALEKVPNSPKQQDSSVPCANQTFRSDAHANKIAGIDLLLNVGIDNPDEFKSANIDRRRDFFSAVDEPCDSFTPARLSSRNSGFGMTCEAQPDDEYCVEQVNNMKTSSENHEMEITFGNAVSENGVVDEKSEFIEPSSKPPVIEASNFEAHHERNGGEVIRAGIQLSTKSMRFFSTPEKEDIEELSSGMISSPDRKLEVDVEQHGTDPSERVCTSDIKLDSHFNQPADSTCPLPRRTSRKSCIGVPLASPDVKEQFNLKLCSEDISSKFEFAIRRNKRKSAIGTRQSENYPDIDPQNPEDYNKLNATPLDGQQYGSEINSGPGTGSHETEPQVIEKDIDLSQDMMNISLNDGDLSESEIEKLHTTSTPCKPRTITEESSWDRKRNRMGRAKTPSSTSDLAHDLSQEMMNISIQSDTRSPLPKKLTIQAPRKSTKTASPPAQPAACCSEFFNCTDVNDKCPSNGTQSNRGLSLNEQSSTTHKVTSGKIGGDDLPYETRLENRDLMRSYGFSLLGSQTNWETLLYDKVLGIRVALPLCRYTEVTRIESIQYTFYSWRIGKTLLLSREIVEFIKTQIHRNIPEEWVREECNKIGDLDRVVSSLKEEVEKLKPLINQLDYVKRRHPCTISNDSISFRVVNTDVRINCKVTLDLKNSHKMSDSYITVENYIGEVNLDTVRLVFCALPSSDVDVLYRFVRYLEGETSKFLVRE